MLFTSNQLQSDFWKKNQIQPVFTIRAKEKQLSSRGEQSEYQTPRGQGSGKNRITHREDLDGEAHIVLPGYTQDVGQIECEVDDAPTGCCQVSPGEERANEEALEDGHHGKH